MLFSVRTVKKTSPKNVVSHTIDTVMENQKELTTPIKKLFTVGVVKG